VICSGRTFVLGRVKVEIQRDHEVEIQRDHEVEVVSVEYLLYFETGNSSSYGWVIP